VVGQLRGNDLCVVVLAVTLAAVGGYDVFAALFLGRAATVSATILDLSRSHPILPFLIGVLVGHLLWPQT
jgi:hypothetical protein